MGLVNCYLRGTLYCMYCVMLGLKLGVKTGVNLEVKWLVKFREKTGSKKLVLAFLKFMDGSVLAFLKSITALYWSP